MSDLRRERLMYAVASLWTCSDSDEDLRRCIVQQKLATLSEDQLDAMYAEQALAPYPKLGRPPLMVGQRKDKMMTLRIPFYDWFCMEEAAHESGVTVSDWARNALRDALQRQGPKTKTPPTSEGRGAYFADW